MAYVSGYPGDEEDEELEGGGEGMPGSGGGSAFAGGSARSSSGSGAPQAGKGTGGMGSFTNLQSYLNANKSDPNSGRILGEQFGKTFGAERSRLESESGAARSSATSMADAGQVDTTYLKSDIDRIYGDGGDAESLKAAQDRMGTYKFGQYNPQQFGFQVGGDAAQLGENLGTEEGFRKARSTAYGKMGGSPYTVGMSALQNQLDVVNPEVQNARKAALEGYASLKGDAEKGVQDTNAFIGQEGQRFQAGQDKFRGDITGLQGTYMGEMNQYLDKAEKNRPNWYEIGVNNSQGTVTQGPTLDSLKGIDSQRNRYNALAEIAGSPQRLNYQPSRYEYENWGPSDGLVGAPYDVFTPGLGYGGQINKTGMMKKRGAM